MSNITVSILLCTFNGEKYLQEQLDSIIAQTHENWKIYASDDGSKDKTLALLNAFKLIHPHKIEILKGEQKGLCRNFLSLAENNCIKSDYYAFCDQDDVWLPEKLERAIEVLALQDSSTPLAYFSRSILVSLEGVPYGYTPLMKQEPSFRNALVQSLAAGNTTLFNHATKHLFEKSKGLSPVIHDWWLYILVTGTNGKVIFDKNAYIHYRQHKNNVIGQKSGIKLLMQRVKRLLNNDISRSNSQNLTTLNSAMHTLDFGQNKRIITEFSNARQLNLWGRLKIFADLKLFRQTFLSNVSLFVAILFNKI